MESILTLESLKDLGSIVGLIGGLSGLFVFFDNYILKFKPTLNISNRLFFRYKLEEKHPQVSRRSIESIILKIEAINSRNKIGRIDDFAVRVHDSRATSPSAYMLYAENFLEKLPSRASSFDEGDLNSFSPVSILGRSSKNFVVEFKPEKYMGTTINPEGGLKLDLLYYLPEKGWRPVETYTPYYYKGSDDQEDPSGIIEYSLLDSAVTRKNASKALRSPESGLYRGVSGKYIGFYVMKPVWFVKKIATYPVKIRNLIIALIEVSSRQVMLYCIAWPVIKYKSKKLPRMEFRPAKSHLASDTNLALKKCKEHIRKLAEEINNTADSSALIIVKSEADDFSFRRGGLEVKLYKSGDGHIRANDVNGYPQIFSFSMELVEYPFRLRLWKVNNKIMTIRSACIHIMDAFILLAH